MIARVCRSHGVGQGCDRIAESMGGLGQRYDRVSEAWVGQRFSRGYSIDEGRVCRRQEGGQGCDRVALLLQIAVKKKSK